MSRIEFNCKVGGKVTIGIDLIKDVGQIISSNLYLEQAHIITDKNVANIHLKALQSSISEANILATTHIIKPGESSKNFITLEMLLEEILSFNPTYNSCIIAIGGGVVGDISGVVASMLLRGVNLVQIPTTLIAQIDSAIGGKSAINSKHGKNLFGSFCTPKLVITDISLLKTLPRKELISGYAEVVKYAMLYDAIFFTWIQENLNLILEKNLNGLFYIVKRCCQMKLEIIQKDKFGTKGTRVMLNFGHTIAHAIESASRYNISHGEAVSIGMVLESTISQINNADMKENLKKAGLPISLREINDRLDLNLLYSSILNDKKIRNNILELTALESIGKSYTEYVSYDFIRNLLNDSL